MLSASDLPETIPLFPLPGALLLPRARLPLNIFEPRYLAMIEDTLKTSHRLIGMIQPRDVPPGTGNPPLHQIGCAGRLTSFSETEDGRYLITLAGISRFRILAQNEGFTPYLRGDVEWDSFLQDLNKKDLDRGFDRPAFLALLKRYFEHSGLTSDWDSMKDAEEELLIN
ncbi:MAG: LON peptidase substrate-binding domain-containing protein, partial [Pseudomonadota bacterium]